MLATPYPRGKLFIGHSVDGVALEQIAVVVEPTPGIWQLLGQDFGDEFRQVRARLIAEPNIVKAKQVLVLGFAREFTIGSRVALIVGLPDEGRRRA